MRILLMVLLLANLGFFAWQQWYDPSRADLPRGEIDAGMGSGLRLVGERVAVESADVAAVEAEQPDTADAESAEPAITESEDLAADAPAESPPLESPAPTGEVCATLGPFERLDVAQVAEDRLESLGSAAAVRESGGQIRSGFWVYLPPYASRSEAKRVEDELRGKNVSDLFIVTGSDQRNAISLGLFSTPERADQRAAEIGRLGYTPRVAERFRDATVYWVDFREQPDDPLEPQRIGVMGASDVLPEKRNIPCPDIAVDADAA